MEQMRKLPIGIQTFEEIRKDNYLYVERLPICLPCSTNIWKSGSRSMEPNARIEVPKNVLPT